MTLPERVRIHTWMGQPLLRIGLKTLLGRLPNIEFGADYHSKSDVTDGLRTGTTGVRDVLFFDRVEDVESEPNLLQGLKASNPHLRAMVLLSVNTPDASVVRSLRIGADAYLSQSASEDEVLRAVSSLIAGRSFLEPQVTPAVLAELRKPSTRPREQDVKVALTDRERMMIQLSADGLNTVQIADVMGIQEKTVRNLWSTLFEKLGMNDRTQTVIWAIRTGLAELR